MLQQFPWLIFSITSWQKYQEMGNYLRKLAYWIIASDNSLVCSFKLKLKKNNFGYLKNIYLSDCVRSQLWHMVSLSPHAGSFVGV